MTSYHKENRQATKEAELAREKAYDVACEALRYARQCKGENVDPTVKQMASTIGKEAAALRKEAKEKTAEAAQARRIACRRAMGNQPIPPLPREVFNGGKMPTPPNRR